MIFCKLNHFINVNDICHIELKRSSFVKRLSKFTPKKLYTIDSKNECRDKHTSFLYDIYLSILLSPHLSLSHYIHTVCVCVCVGVCVCVCVCENEGSLNIILTHPYIYTYIYIITSRSTRRCPGSNVSLCMANSF
jgi:hypothetical protein